MIPILELLTFGTSPFLPEIDHEVLKGLIAKDLLEQLLPVEGLTESPN